MRAAKSGSSSARRAARPVHALLVRVEARVVRERRDGRAPRRGAASAPACRRRPSRDRRRSGRPRWGPRTGPRSPGVPGGSPLARNIESGTTWNASSERRSETSARWPTPVRSRAKSAARIAWAAKNAPVMSAAGTPTLTGGPSAEPVTLMIPLTAWTTPSTPGRSRQGPVLAERRDGRVDEPRVALRQGLVADPEPIGDARAEALEADVALVGEAQHDVAAGLRLLEVDGEAALVAVHAEERRGDPVDEWGPEPSPPFAAGRLDLDDLRPEVAEQHRAGRARRSL